MIRAVTVTNHLGESYRLDLFDPEPSGFYIKSIEGLGPPTANVNITELATIDGGIDNSARLTSRSILIDLGFMEKDTIEETRHLSYKYFPIKRNVKLEVETDTRICYAIGRVETNTPNIFSKTEGCQISILCTDPYFYESKGSNVISYGTEPLFEFPFENNGIRYLEELVDQNKDVIVDDKGRSIHAYHFTYSNEIEFGEIKKSAVTTVEYPGDLETGVIIRAHARGPVKNFRIYFLRNRQIISINDEKLKKAMGSGISAGDEIIINTIKKQKGIWIMRNAKKKKILAALEKPIEWFEISKGENTFVYRADGLENMEVNIEYNVIYEGI